MDQIETAPVLSSQAATPEPPNQPREAARLSAFAAPVAIGALALTAGLSLMANRRRTAQRVPPSFAPADKTLAWASPAVVAGVPARRFYDGRNLDRAVSVEDLRAMAHRRLPRFALEYLEGGSEDEATLARNIAAFAEWRFRHRSLVDVAKRDVSTTLFGRRMAMPVAIAPTGLNGLFWPNADTHLAEAAALAGIPFAQSTMSNDRMERVARVPGLRHWWQLYVFGPAAIRDALIDRAVREGCEALIVTTDAQIYGNREWHRRTTSDPKHLTWSSKWNTLGHPRWLASGLLRHGMPCFENVIDFVPKDRRRFFDSAHWIRSQMDRTLDWNTVARIRERWPRRLIVKGLLCVEDVVRAAELGADAVAISNHGGRQLDWAVSPLDLLPAARAAVGGRIAILVDGGIRRGADVIKAVALGADAVLIGRAALYGVAAAGREGVSCALEILREEIDRDLGLLGADCFATMEPKLLTRCEAGR